MLLLLVLLCGCGNGCDFVRVLVAGVDMRVVILVVGEVECDTGGVGAA